MINLVLKNGEFYCIDPKSITKISGTSLELHIHTSDGTVVKITRENPEAAASFVEQIKEYFPEIEATIASAMDHVTRNDGQSEEMRARVQGLPQESFRDNKQAGNIF
jgi:hypothetical protein